MHKGLRRPKVDSIFTRTLTESVPPQSGGTAPNWLLASRYVRAHLAAHAARWQRLQKLTSDPLYLLAADPTRLMREMSTHASPGLYDVSAVYRGALHHIRQEPPTAAASYLELASRQRSLSVFAEKVAALPLQRPWSVPWPRWIPRTPSRAFGRGTRPISARTAVPYSGSQP